MATGRRLAEMIAGGGSGICLRAGVGRRCMSIYGEVLPPEDATTNAGMTIEPVRDHTTTRERIDSRGVNKQSTMRIDVKELAYVRTAESQTNDSSN